MNPIFSIAMSVVQRATLKSLRYEANMNRRIRNLETTNDDNDQEQRNAGGIIRANHSQSHLSRWVSVRH